MPYILSILLLLPLFFQGCVRYYTSTKSPVISGYVHNYSDYTAKEGINIGGVQSDSKGHFILPDSQADDGDGFSIVKRFTLSIDNKDILCQCSTILPHAETACDQIHYFTDIHNNTLYYFNASIASPSLICGSKEIDVLPLESQNDSFIVIAAEDEQDESLGRRLYLYFSSSIQYDFDLNARTRACYLESIDALLPALMKQSASSQKEGLTIAQISRQSVYDFFISNEERFFASVQERLKQEQLDDSEANYNKIVHAYHKTLDKLKTGKRP